MPSVRVSELGSDDKPQEAIVLDMTEAAVKKLKIGEKVEVVISGTVGMLSVPPDPEMGGTPELGIRVKTKRILGGKESEIADLAEDRDED